MTIPEQNHSTVAKPWLLDAVNGELRGFMMRLVIVSSRGVAADLPRLVVPSTVKTAILRDHRQSSEDKIER